MRVQQSSRSFALCVEDGGMEDLEARKLYQILPDREAAREGYIRVVDESGEDYIYPSDLFVSVRLPAAVVRRRRYRGRERPPLPPPVEVRRLEKGGAHAPDACRCRPAEPRLVRDTAECVAGVARHTRMDFMAGMEFPGFSGPTSAACDTHAARGDSPRA